MVLRDTLRLPSSRFVVGNNVKKVLITPQSAPNRIVISTSLPCNQCLIILTVITNHYAVTISFAHKTLLILHADHRLQPPNRWQDIPHKRFR